MCQHYDLMLLLFELESVGFNSLYLHNEMSIRMLWDKKILRSNTLTWIFADQFRVAGWLAGRIC